ncbi:protein kinase domain-containing protein [Bogoriella caseilytica]|uniref:non-specific serine/threonine protein kinase n=1 Tax=Bogoriella caseilytica TaxID=56055 RepID=A0A3N2B990_9MICO|nr:protein kinase [Bogoriella caseilytica]ROR71810.1 protein kinase-like protein [Bogoriella caseilytica]
MGKRKAGRRADSEIAARPAVPGYELGAPVGFGASGAVWSARGADGRPLVVSLAGIEDGRPGEARLRRLARLRSISHPNLPQIVEVVPLSAPSGRCAVVAEEVTGPSLATVCAARAPLTTAEAGTLLDGVGSALGRLHELGVIHGDVAPSNVVIAEGGRPVLVDLVGDVTAEKGTPGYVAPERRAGGPASAAADVWALATLVAGASADDLVTDIMAAGRAALPEDRPSARKLVAAGTRLGKVPIEIPHEGALAEARLRAPAATTHLAGNSRPRRRHRRGRRRAALLSGAGVLTVVLGAGAATLASEVGSTVSEEAPQASEPRTSEEPGTAVLRPGTDLAAVFRDLIAERDAALSALDAAALTSLTVPGSEPAAADAALLAELSESGLQPEGLRTDVIEIRDPQRSNGSARAEVVTAQQDYTLAGAGHRHTVPAQSERCAVLTLERTPADGMAGAADGGEQLTWRLAAVGSCE